jgi:hypothetical protein
MKPEQESLDIIRDNVNHVIELARIEHDHEGMRVLEIGLLKGGAKDTFKHATVETLDINGVADWTGDICNARTLGMPYGYDCVICTEVLEHTNEPFIATININGILNVNGRAYITTPFNFRIHNPLPDNWRFTEHGLRQLFRNFNILELKGIGGSELNPTCYRLIAQKQ